MTTYLKRINWSLLAGHFLAIMAACLLSSLVVWRRRESLLIPILLFIGALVSSWTQYCERSIVRKALAFLRYPFEQFPLEVRLAIVGGALVAIGIILLLLPLRWRIGAGTTATPQVAS